MKIFNKSEWKKVKLGDICDILDSRRIPISEEKRIKGKYPYYGANGIQGYINDYIFDEELVLLAEDGGNFGSKTKPIAYKINGKTWVNNHAHVLKAKNKIISTDFLLYSLMFYNVTKLITGTTRKKLTRTGMEKITLFIPNLDMQEKITNYLQKIEKFVFFRKNQLTYLKELNKSLFTRMFGTPEYNEKGWNFISLKDISYTKGEYGSNKPAINYNGGYRYIRITDINATGELKTEKVGVSDEEIEAQKYALKENDILFARSGATVGKNFLYNKKYGKCIFAGYLIRFKLNPHLISTKYLKIYLDTNYYWNWVKNCQNIVAQPNINAKQYGEDLKIMLPPIELQNKFAERVEKIEKLSFEIEKSIKEAENLYNSLMNKYFD
ncbi:restriction endonuclease subunit S [Fusobacterium polymorphum]|uniref:restriction endonuclease subunit S n=1 Tax=Fusobacterium nucleatum subsp. polymorphum TaxID=76857 RepID=UPI001C6DEF86|nr:restriction endonuclease subunit S [Fusobacterium polymorphum]QYR58175.1 restriction endonuclease subunit S [Fusobacterium polymorphum]